MKRLTAAGTVRPQWGQAYTYDGFGNLTAAAVTQGSGVNWANASSAATNQMIGVSYDANGNNITPGAPCCATSYDVENRIISQYLDRNTPNWAYDPSGKRVAQANIGPPGYEAWTLYFYDIFGRPIETWTGDQDYPNSLATLATNVYFGSKLVQSNGVTVVTDRLGSVRANSSGERFSYLPYGYERTASANARVKFGTYLQDASDQDYADQRYFNSWYGRFNTPDPIGSRAVNPQDPTSWNMYTYAGGDPVNRNDPTRTDGLCDLDWYLDGAMPIGCGGDSTWNGPFPPIPGCGGIQPDQFNPGIGMACLAFLQVASPQPAPPPTPPSCTVEVGYITSVYNTKYSHSFLEIGYAGIDQYIEVSPNLAGILTNGGPTMRVNITSTGIYDDSTQGIDFWSETGSKACFDAAGIYADAENFPPAWYLGLISNSNTFVSTVLGDVGITAPPLVNGPPNAIGWGGPIVWAPIGTTPVPRPRPGRPRPL